MLIHASRSSSQVSLIVHVFLSRSAPGGTLELFRKKSAPIRVSVQWKTLIFDTEKRALNNANANRILYK